MKNLLIIIITFTVLAGCKTEKNSENNPTASTITESFTSELENDKIVLGNLEKRIIQDWVQCTGKVTIPPTDLVSVHSKTSGNIEFMKYLPGDYIVKGKLLFTISNPDLLIKQREFLEIKEKFDLSKKVYDRKTDLFEANVINEKEFQQAESSKQLLEASYEGRLLELKLLGINTESLLTEGKLQSNVPIYSAISGYVQAVYVNKGQMIEPNIKLMDIANDQHVLLELQVLAKDVPQVSKGQKVIFTLPKKAMELHAEIKKLNPLLNEDNGTRTVYCQINSEACQYVLPGMFVNASIEVEGREVQGIPSEGVLKEGQEYFIYRKTKEGLKKEKIEHPEIMDDFFIFEAGHQDTFVLKGAYYIE